MDPVDGGRLASSGILNGPKGRVPRACPWVKRSLNCFKCHGFSRGYLQEWRKALETAKPGWAEQDMEPVWQAVKQTIRESLKNSRLASSDIIAVGIVGQGDGRRLIH